MEKKNDLLDVFVTEKDKNGFDIMEMSDFFSVFMNRIDSEIEEKTTWKIYENVDGLIGEIAEAIKCGVDISKMGMLVADNSHFSKEIVDGLKSGVYHVGQSKEVAGNLRPAILDKNENFVKFFTLKKAIDPKEVLSDISLMSMQHSLQRISAQIEEISYDVETVIDFERRETLSTKFIWARDKIMLAQNATDEEQMQLLREADTYLLEGLGSLYSDVNDQVKKLAQKGNPTARIKTIDKLLVYINEDMQMIPKYVALRSYLLNYRGKTEDACRVLLEYKQQLTNMSERKTIKGKYTKTELIHKYYPYKKDEIDFWLERPKQMIASIEAYECVIENKESDVFYIDAEGE